MVVLPSPRSPRPSSRLLRRLRLAALVCLGATIGGAACSRKDVPSYDPPVASASASALAAGTARPAGSARGDSSAKLTNTPAPATSGNTNTPPPMIEEDAAPKTLEEQREQMFHRMSGMMGLSDVQLAAVRAIVEKSHVMSQGNPAISVHPMSRKECREAREAAGVVETTAEVCGAPFMAPLYNRETEKPADAKLCIDRYEFPGIPCEYPMTWVSSHDAELLCKAVGKRLCDAHEWEGACAGAVGDPKDEYNFKKPRKQAKFDHNKARELVWAYGKTKDHKKCGTGSFKSKTCSPIGWKRCGTNTYPTGAFPACVSPFGVYDQHGNAAEHMSLPIQENELGAKGGVGQTEMKGSWFIFSQIEAHEDDCHWRAPDWHASKVMDPNSHANYHLGFRCCKDVGATELASGRRWRRTSRSPRDSPARARDRGMLPPCSSNPS
jgi:formylglycine-generating enzyme